MISRWGSSARSLVSVVAITGLLVAAQAVIPDSRAEAQCVPGSDTCSVVTADAKGIVGLGLIGAEIGFMIPALFVAAGVQEFDEWWAYLLFPSVFGAAGALTGYFALEEPVQDSGQRGFPEVAVAMLAIGMALIVPTFVGVLALTSYNPGSDGSGGGSEDRGGDMSDDDFGDEPAPAASPEDAAARARQRMLAGGPGLLRFDRGAILLGIPMVGSQPTYTAEETERMQLAPSFDVVVPVVSGVFF